jgi:membrane protease subunit (stomatin/prohibitin family)
VGTRLYTDMKWGTQEPVTVRDSEFGMVRLRAFGTFGMRVTDPAALIREMVGTDPNFSTDEVQEFLREKMVSEVGTALATSGVPMLDLAANQQAISQKLAETLTASFADIGIAIPKFIIQNISLPPEVSAALDKRTQMGVLGNLDQFTKFQAATAITEAASNPGGVAGAGIGLGAGLAMGQQMTNAMSQAAAPAPAAAAPPPLPGQAGYFLGVNGQQVGPVTIAEMPGRIASGELTPDTLVWREGMAEWTRAGDVPEVNATFPAAPPPLPPSAPPAPPSA